MRVRSLAVVAMAFVASWGGELHNARAQTPLAVGSLARADVTIYAASWCSACRTLEKGLRERDVPFDIVDVDKNPDAFAKARQASGAGSAIPLTGVARATDTLWIVGADIDGVERGYRNR
jgi:mycoredoxin